MIFRKLKINSRLSPHNKGDVIDIKCSDDGMPADKYWRNRLKDSEIDKCVEFVDDKPTDSGDKKSHKQTKDPKKS